MMVILRKAVARLSALAVIFAFVSTGCGEFAQDAPPSKGSKPIMTITVALSKTPFKPGSANGPLSAAKVIAITSSVTASDMEEVTKPIPIDTLRATLAVPVGKARTFTVTVDTLNDGSFSDSQTVDLKPNLPVNLVFSFGIYTVAGTVSGLHSWIILQNNGGDDLIVTENGTFEFDASLADGSDYDVAILTTPSGHICAATNSSGALSGNNVTNIEIACISENYAVGGAVSGLDGTLVLQNNVTDDLTLTLNGFFTFYTEIEGLFTYDVTVLTQPSGQTCTVTNESGNITNIAATNVTVTCVDNNYTLGGSVNGITGNGLVLQNNGGENLTIPADGTFTFPATISNGDSYNITVLTNPNGQTCAITNASGTIGGTDITSVAVTCADIPTYTVGGAISGISSTVVLQNNGGDNLTITSNGNFTFATALKDGMNYVVTMSTHPAGQTCSVTNESGTIGGADITSVAVTCTNIPSGFYTVGGSVSGLSDTATLQNNGGDDLIIAVDGTLTFPTAIVDSSPYNVTILTQPSGQTCALTNASGTISSANVTNVTITCTNNLYTVGGSISGLGSTVVLQNNSGDNLILTANGTFNFTSSILNGDPYNVTVLTQPTGQTCTLTNASGTISGANVTGVTVTCTNNLYTVGGATSGLGSWLILQNNGGDNLTITSNGAFTFATGITNGSGYNVTILTQPTGQTCTLTNASGTINAANITGVTITCTSNIYTVGGAVSGLSSTVVLQNNSGDNLTISSDGSFTFATGLINGSGYNVTILTQPTGQTCALTNASGTISAANITDVTITCTSNLYTVGGSISGLSSTVILRNNGGDDLTLTASGNFTFATALVNGYSYSVTIALQKAYALETSKGQTCTVGNGSGTINAANITNITVTCSSNQN